MSNAATQEPNRLDRRKARTRAALIRAAQTLIAEGRTHVPILEITQAADVGMGSFYNHFETKEQLFDAAVEAVMDGYGQLLDDLTGDIEDPAEVFACSFRLTGRLQRREPELSRVFLNNVLRLLSADSGLAPRARRDIKTAVDAGRFTRQGPRRRGHDGSCNPARPRPAAARPAGARRRGDHRPDDRRPSAHVRRAGRDGSSPLPAAATRPRGLPGVMTSRSVLPTNLIGPQGAFAKASAISPSVWYASRVSRAHSPWSDHARSARKARSAWRVSAS